MPHLTLDKLSDYAAGRLTEDELGSVSDHLDFCSECQSSLSSLEASNDAVIQGLKGIASQPFGEEPEMAAAILAARQIGAMSTQLGDAELTAQLEKKPSIPGEYEILKKIGEGGMGVVYEARHTKLDRIVALKVLRTDRIGRSDFIARFMQELKAIGKVDHPNIVRAYDAREAEGEHFLVMELLNGIDLSELVDAEGMLPMADACELIRQAAVGLQYAHDRGLIHRDVKPSNIMLTSGGVVKLLDLGLSRLLALEVHAPNQSIELSTELTSSQQIIGTIDYMAPEQYLDGRRADARSDVYSLGASLYKLLTGRAPYSSREFDTLGKKLAALAGSAPTPMTINRHDVPKELLAVLERMLAKNPDDRFQSVREVEEALAPFAKGHHIQRYLAQDHVAAQHRNFVSPQQSNTSAARTTGPRPRVPRSWLIAAGAIPIAALFIALLTIDTPNGKLVVEVPSEARDQVQVSITNGDEIHVLDQSKNWAIELNEGVWQVQLDDPTKSFKLDGNVATISAGKTEIIKVAFAPKKQESSQTAGEKADDAWQNFECNVYTMKYKIDEEGVVHLPELRWKVMPRYIGNVPHGQVVDDRLTVVLVDEKNSFWPVIMKMSEAEGERFQKGLTNLLANAKPSNDLRSDEFVDCTLITRSYDIDENGKITLPSGTRWQLVPQYVNAEERFIENRPTLLIEDPKNGTTPVRTRMSTENAASLLKDLKAILEQNSRTPPSIVTLKSREGGGKDVVANETDPGSSEVFTVETAQATRPTGGPNAIFDETDGISITVPGGWERWWRSDFVIPWAEVRYAWTGPGTSCLVVAVRETGEPDDPREILDGLAKARVDDFGVEVLAREVRTVAGMRAAWLVVKGKGTGNSIDGVGEVDTIDHFVVVPRQDNTAVVVLVTCAAENYDDAKETLGKALDNLQLSGSQTDRQRRAN